MQKDHENGKTQDGNEASKRGTVAGNNDWMWREASSVAHYEIGLITLEQANRREESQNVPDHLRDFIFFVAREGVRKGRKCLGRCGLDVDAFDYSTTVRDIRTGEDMRVDELVGHEIVSTVQKEVRRSIPPTHELLEQLFIGYVRADGPKPVIHLGPTSVHVMQELSWTVYGHKPVDCVDGYLLLHIYDPRWDPISPGCLQVYKQGEYHNLVPIDGVLEDWEWRKIWNGLMTAAALCDRELGAAQIEQDLRGAHTAHGAQILSRLRAAIPASERGTGEIGDAQDDTDGDCEAMQEGQDA